MPTQNTDSSQSHTGRIASDRILETLDAQGHSVLWLADRIGSSLEDLAVELLMYDRLTVYTITRSARALHVPFESLLTRVKPPKVRVDIRPNGTFDTSRIAASISRNLQGAK